MRNRVPAGFALLAFILTAPVSAQAQASAEPPQATADDGVVAQIDPDLSIDLVETDFALAALPTTLRMPAGKFAFRLTHRFSRPVAEGDAGDFFADFFGFDSSAKIGLEFRYGIRPGTQMTVYRTNDRVIQLLGQHQVLRQEDGHAVTAHALVAVEGADNFSEDFGTTLGAVIARRLGEQAKVYAHPMVVLNSNPSIADAGADDYTVVLGLGTRVRLGQSFTYVVIEAAPRLAGYDPGSTHVSVAVEKQYGGHVFQLNVSSNLGTSMRQLARGGPAGDDWFIGFNLVRRFF